MSDLRAKNRALFSAQPNANKIAERAQAPDRRQANIPASQDHRIGGDRRKQDINAVFDRRTGRYQQKSVMPGHGNDPEYLKELLALCKTSPANLSREANVSRPMISSVLHGRTRSTRIEQLVAERTGHTLHALFPAWYRDNEE